MADGLTAPEANPWDDVRRAAIEAVRAAIVAPWPDSDVEEIADAALAVCDEEATRRLSDYLIAESRFRSLRAVNGRACLDAEPAREVVAHWVLASRGLLDGAENYVEISMEFGDRARGERYAFTLQRVGKLTPHQARQRAEAERDRLQAGLRRLADQAPTVPAGATAGQEAEVRRSYAASVLHQVYHLHRSADPCGEGTCGSAPLMVPDAPLIEEGTGG